MLQSSLQQSRQANRAGANIVAFLLQYGYIDMAKNSCKQLLLGVFSSPCNLNDAPERGLLPRHKNGAVQGQEWCVPAPLKFPTMLLPPPEETHARMATHLQGSARRPTLCCRWDESNAGVCEGEQQMWGVWRAAGMGSLRPT
eukprot:1157012-Pelagomonas_calceolata.AAC.4